MTLTIIKGEANGILVKGPAKFRETWGNVVKIPEALIYINLSEIATWVNNELNEACLFEVE